MPQNPMTALVREAPREEFYGPLFHLNKKSLTISEAEKNPGRVIGWDADLAGTVRLAAVAEPGGKWSYLYRDTEATPWQPLALPLASDVVTFDATGQQPRGRRSCEVDRQLQLQSRHEAT